MEILKLDSVASIKAKLEDNIRSIVEKRNEAQRNITASVQFLAPYDPNVLKRDSELFQIFQKELGVSPSSGVSVGTEKIDFRDQFKT